MSKIKWDVKMTEKEKMLKQMLYDANYDHDLLVQRTKAKELCYDFNNLRPSDEKGQIEILKKLLGKTKNNHTQDLKQF